MPYYAHHMPTHMPRARQLPLTPPDVWGNGSVQVQRHYGAIGQHYYDQSIQEQMNVGVIKRPMRYDGYELSQPVSAPMYSNYHGQEYGYETQIPVLPPIRTYDLPTMEPKIQAVEQPVAEPKDEKVAGGVASSLTYKMDQMVDFVSEMATAMHDLLQDGTCYFRDMDVANELSPTSPQPSFRKYVSQVLTSTRLPISTIMLAMRYLARRMDIVQHSPDSTQATLFQMLTTALMLASKFLDDNTFQNRSWAEVSHTPVVELNKHEVAWLLDMQWGLHFNVEGTFKSWFLRFEEYAKNKDLQTAHSRLEALKMSQPSLNETHRQTPTRYAPQTPLYTPPSYYEQSYNQPRERPNPWQQWPAHNVSPHSAGSSFPTTPAEWFRNPSSGFGQHSMTFSSRPLPPVQILPSNQTAYYGDSYPQYAAPAWSAHPIGCHCYHCVPGHVSMASQEAYGVPGVA